MYVNIGNHFADLGGLIVKQVKCGSYNGFTNYSRLDNTCNPKNICELRNRNVSTEKISCFETQ